MARRAADFPDAVVGLVPAALHGVDDLLDQQVVRLGERAAGDRDRVGQLDDRPEHVELHLLRCGVADAHGPAAGVARNGVDHALRARIAAQYRVQRSQALGAVLGLREAIDVAEQRVGLGGDPSSTSAIAVSAASRSQQ